MVDGPNLYEYVRGNPVKLVDPNGMQANDEAPEVPDYPEDRERRDATADDSEIPAIVEREGNNVNITLYVRFEGEDISEDRKDAWVEAAEDMWTDEFGIYDVNLDIIESSDDAAAIIHVMEDVLGYVGEFGATNISGLAVVVGLDTETLQNAREIANQRAEFRRRVHGEEYGGPMFLLPTMLIQPDESSITFSHEVGHFLGLKDRHEESVNNEGEVSRELWEGWNESLMGTERELTEVHRPSPEDIEDLLLTHGLAGPPEDFPSNEETDPGFLDLLLRPFIIPPLGLPQ